MKKKNIKPIVVSALLATAFGATSIGTSFALFTDSASTSINVTAGKVDISTVASTPIVYSAEANPEGTVLDENNHKYSLVDQTGNTFKNGGTASIASDGTITISKMTPGDGVRFNLATTNNSNVALKYRFSMTSDGDVILLGGLKTTIENKTATTTAAKFTKKTYDGLRTVKTDWIDVAADAGTGALGTFNFDIYLPLTRGNKYQNREVSFNIGLEVVQGNALVEGEKEEVSIPEIDGVINTISDVTTFAATGGYWVLGNNYTETTYTAINAPKDSVLDLNGYDLNVDNGFVMIPKGTLTITDTSNDHSGSIVKTTNGNPVFYCTAGNTLNLENLDVSSTYRTAWIAGGTLNMTDCNITCGGTSSPIDLRSNTTANILNSKIIGGQPVGNAYSGMTINVEHSEIDVTGGPALRVGTSGSIQVVDSEIKSKGTTFSAGNNSTVKVEGTEIESDESVITVPNTSTELAIPNVSFKDSNITYAKTSSDSNDCDFMKLVYDNTYVEIDNCSVLNEKHRVDSSYQHLDEGTNAINISDSENNKIVIKNGSYIKGVEHGILSTGKNNEVQIINSTIEGEDTGIFTEDNLFLTTEGSTIKGGEIGLQTFGTNNRETTLNLKDTNVLSSNGCSMYIAACKSMTIDGGEYEGKYLGVEVRAGEILIKGNARFVCDNVATTDYQYEVRAEGSGTTTTGAALAFAQHMRSDGAPDLYVDLQSCTVTGLVGVSYANPLNNATNNVSLTIDSVTYQNCVSNLVNTDSRITL